MRTSARKPRNRFTTVLIAAATLLLAASGALASAVNSRPVGPLGDNDLQNMFGNTPADSPPGIYVSGPVYDPVADQTGQAVFRSTASGGSIATFVIELSASSNTNRFGLYDAADPTKKVQLFDGSATTGSITLVSFLADGRVLVFFVDSGVTDFSGIFGFYVDVYEAAVGAGGDGNAATFDYTVWSEDTRNPGGAAQALSFQGNDATSLVIAPFAAGLFTSGSWILAFEDALVGGPDAGSSDRDYSDLVVLVDSIDPVRDESVPAVSDWGLAVMLLLVLTGAKVRFGRQPRTAS